MCQSESLAAAPKPPPGAVSVHVRPRAMPRPSSASVVDRRTLIPRRSPPPGPPPLSSLWPGSRRASVLAAPLLWYIALLFYIYLEFVRLKSLNFVDRSSLPKGIVLYTDDDEWSTWKKIGDEVLHIEP
jgi:hypothetical protein